MNYKAIILFVCIYFLLPENNFAQTGFTRYIVSFKNKGNSNYTFSNPAAYLSPKAIERRTRYHINIDSTDLPVTPVYLQQLAAIPGVTILNTSRWFNQVAVRINDVNTINTINALPFVQQSQPIAARTTTGVNTPPVTTGNTTIQSAQRIQNTLEDFYDYGTVALAEINLHNGQFLHNMGMRGQQMQIAMLDAGYYNYTSLPAFDSMNKNNQVSSTWDFVAGNNSVAEDHAHGMQCLSIIAANIPGSFIGKAPRATFHLFRTEDAASEYPIEEFNWLSAAERSDSVGADIISSSLGYADFDYAPYSYTYAQLNGKTSMAAKAATLASRKGLLVVVANGNSGNSSWHYLLTPADADSVLSVGAVNTAAAVWPNSSYGPAADGRIKPDVASVGWGARIQGSGGGLAAGNGTSYACPNMAGLATCLWQAFPEFNNLKIIETLRLSSNQYNTPDDRVGYGIPDMKQAFGRLLVDYATASQQVSNCITTLTWQTKDIGAMRYEIERKLPNAASYTTIGTVAAVPGDSLTKRTYQFNNNIINEGPGNISYRIKQITDTTQAGFAAVYLDTVTVQLNNACTVTPPVEPIIDTSYVKIVPNPVYNHQSNLLVYTPTAIEQLHINIYSHNGQLIAELKQTKPAGGLATYLLPVAKMSKGEYFIKIWDKQRLLFTTKLLRL
jgi:serine protease AprX